MTGEEKLRMYFFDEQGAEAYLQTFCWEATDKTVVFASKYYKRLKICKLSDQLELVREIDVNAPYKTPDERVCYYTDIVCGKDKIYALSQEDIKAETMSGTSKIDVFDYDGKMLKTIALPGIYLLMSASSDSLMLMPVDCESIDIIKQI